MTKPVTELCECPMKKHQTFQYRIGRIPGVGLNLAAVRVSRQGHLLWIRNLGTSPRAMRIARLIGRL